MVEWPGLDLLAITKPIGTLGLLFVVAHIVSSNKPAVLCLARLGKVSWTRRLVFVPAPSPVADKVTNSSIFGLAAHQIIHYSGGTQSTTPLHDRALVRQEIALTPTDPVLVAERRGCFVDRGDLLRCAIVTQPLVGLLVGKSAVEMAMVAVTGRYAGAMHIVSEYPVFPFLVFTIVSSFVSGDLEGGQFSNEDVRRYHTPASLNQSFSS
jgi:hypothetical protein